MICKDIPKETNTSKYFLNEAKWPWIFDFLFESYLLIAAKSHPRSQLFELYSNIF